VLSENQRGVPAAKTQTILRNSFLYGLETALGMAAAFVATVLVARILGPERIAYYNYLYWLVLTSGSVGSVGLPATTRKYMAEFLGRAEPGSARAVYVQNLRLQCWLSGSITAGALLVALFFALPGYKTVACLLVASMFPRMLSFIPSMANNASQNLYANVPGAAAGTMVMLLCVVLSLSLGWDLVGLSTGVFLSSAIECVLKLHSAWGPLRRHPAVRLSSDVTARMRSFSGQNVMLLILTLVVWDRSDLVLLRQLGKHLVDVTFFSVAFSLTDRLLLLPQTFHGAIGSTLMVEQGRDPASAGRMVESTLRYSVLMGFPLMIGLSAISPALVTAVYGSRYSPVIPLLTVMALLAIPKALLAPAQTFLGAHEKQGFLVKWFLCCGAWNVAVDALLIPRYGALGAAWGNGTAQLLAALGVWVFAVHRFGLRVPYGRLARIAISAIVMGACVAFLARILPPWPGVLAGLAAAFVVLPTALWATRSLADEDYRRFAPLAQRLPKLLVPFSIRILKRLTRT
jgi:O-antigen/teichoic acid export membrane protein